MTATLSVWDSLWQVVSSGFAHEREPEARGPVSRAEEAREPVSRAEEMRRRAASGGVVAAPGGATGRTQPQRRRLVHRPISVRRLVRPIGVARGVSNAP